MIPKFRGRSIVAFSEEEWKYGYLIEDEGYSFIINQVIEANEQYITIGSWCPVNPDTLGQSTGLFDKNGVEIFEGDILKVVDKYEDTGGSIEAVSYSKAQASFITKDIEKNIYRLCNTLMFEVEVIGNIYQNPELFEV